MLSTLDQSYQVAMLCKSMISQSASFHIVSNCEYFLDHIHLLLPTLRYINYVVFNFIMSRLCMSFHRFLRIKMIQYVLGPRKVCLPSPPFTVITRITALVIS